MNQKKRESRIFFRSIEEIHNETGGVCMGDNPPSPKNMQLERTIIVNKL